MRACCLSLRLALSLFLAVSLSPAARCVDGGTGEYSGFGQVHTVATEFPCRSQQNAAQHIMNRPNAWLVGLRFHSVGFIHPFLRILRPVAVAAVLRGKGRGAHSVSPVPNYSLCVAHSGAACTVHPLARIFAFFIWLAPIIVNVGAADQTARETAGASTWVCSCQKTEEVRL